MTHESQVPTRTATQLRFWPCRLLSCFWTSWCEPTILRAAILPLQEQVEAIAPQGWTLGLDNFSLGDVAPSISGFQVRRPLGSVRG